MTLLVLENFLGYNRLIDEHAVPDGVAADAVNVDVSTRVLRPFLEPELVSGVSLNLNARSVYEIIHDGNSYWLSWSEDVYLAYVPEGKVDTRNIVFASPSFEPRWGTASDLASGSPPYPTTFYVLGVHPPVTAPSVTTTGGSAANESRTYVYTFVNADGHESAPSPASSVVTAPSDATWTVTVPDTAPPNSGNITNTTTSGTTITLTLDSVFGLRAKEQVSISLPGLSGVFRIDSVDASTNQITITSSTAPTGTAGTWSRVAPHKTTGLKKRLYRSTGSGYSLVTNPDGTAYEVDASVTTMTDDTTKGLGENLPTYDRLMPPADLEQVVALPNGMLAGFRGSEVCFSEPYIFYAWPAEYHYGLEYEVKGVAAVGNTLFVATSGSPYAFSGSTPDTMSQSVIGPAYPCVNGKTVAAFDDGIIYASSVGMVVLSHAGARVLTRDIVAVPEWEKIAQSTIQGIFVNGRYYMSYVNSDGVVRIIMGDLVHQEYGLMDISVTDTECIGTDVSSSKLYLVKNGALYEWNRKDGAYLQFDWRSKRYFIPAPTSFNAFRVDARFTPDEKSVSSTEALRVQLYNDNLALINSYDDTGSMNGSALNTIPFNGSKIVNVEESLPTDLSLTVELYSDKKLIHSFTVTDERIYRLPYLGRYSDIQVRFIGRPTVFRALLASNPTELRRV